LKNISLQIAHADAPSGQPAILKPPIIPSAWKSFKQYPHRNLKFSAAHLPADAFCRMSKPGKKNQEIFSKDYPHFTVKEIA